MNSLENNSMYGYHANVINDSKKKNYPNEYVQKNESFIPEQIIAGLSLSLRQSSRKKE